MAAIREYALGGFFLSNKTQHDAQPRSSRLCEELVQELVRVVDREGQEYRGADPWRFRSLLRQILGEAWAEVSRSNFSALHQLMVGLVEAEEIVQPHLPDPGEPRVEAAREVYQAAYVLSIAETFVHSEKTRARLGERRRSLFERKVLRVLLERKNEYLRRAEILKEMEKLLPPPYPDPSRVSQILADLYRERLVMRTQGSAQGNSQTSFFALSRQGLDLCRGLSFAVPLFEPDSSKWQHLLLPSQLAAGPDEKGRDERIAAFYRPRPGVGCSLAIVHCSILLAQAVRDLEQPDILVLDFDGEESSLKDYFATPARDCRGLAGLLDDYHAQPEVTQREWLGRALFQGTYSCRPCSSIDNLFYLPPFPRKGWADQFQIYAGLMRELRSEIEQQERPDGKPAFASSGFLGDLRYVLRGRCAKTLILAPTGLSTGAYLASVLLAEELVLFLHPSDSERANVQSVMREVVGNCLSRRETAPEAKPAFTFVFSPLPLEEEVDLPKQIERLLVPAQGEVREEDGGQAIYRIVRLHFDARLTGHWPLEIGALDPNQRQGLLTAGYQHLVESLHPKSSLVPGYWQSRDKDMEEKVRLRVVEAQLGRISRSADVPATYTGEALYRSSGGRKDVDLKPEPQAIVRHEENLEEGFQALDVLDETPVLAEV